MENKWTEVAKLFNLELGEKFYIKHINSKKPYKELYKFTEDGLKIYIDDGWSDEYESVLFHLLNGDNEIIKKPGKPKKGERYYYWDFQYNYSSYTSFEPSYDYDLFRWKTGNCFRTNEEAETKGKELMEQIKKEYESENI